MIARYGYGQYALVMGEKRYLGKIIYVGSKTIFFKSYKKKVSLMRKSQSLSFDVRLFPNLNRHRVEEVHFAFPGELYVVTYSRARERGAIENNGEGSQLYVKLQDFELKKPFYREPFGKSDEWISTPQDHRPRPPKRAKARPAQKLLFQNGGDNEEDGPNENYPD